MLFLEMHQMKAEIEALSSVSINYLSSKYIPEKMKQFINKSAKEGSLKSSNSVSLSPSHNSFGLVDNSSKNILSEN